MVDLEKTYERLMKEHWKRKRKFMNDVGYIGSSDTKHNPVKLHYGFTRPTAHRSHNENSTQITITGSVHPKNLKNTKTQHDDLKPKSGDIVLRTTPRDINVEKIVPDEEVYV